MLIDYHIHTYYSDDCKYPMEEVVKDAISIGAKEICFTDHVDYGVKTDWNSGEEVGKIIMNIIIRKCWLWFKITKITVFLGI